MRNIVLIIVLMICTNAQLGTTVYDSNSTLLEAWYYYCHPSLALEACYTKFSVPQKGVAPHAFDNKSVFVVLILYYAITLGAIIFLLMLSFGFFKPRQE